MPADAPADIGDRIVGLIERRIGVIQEFALAALHLRAGVEIRAAQNDDPRADELLWRVESVSPVGCRRWWAAKVFASRMAAKVFAARVAGQDSAH